MIDRDMMKWVPFSAIKEQFEGLNELYEKQNHVPIPIVDEQQLESLNLIVCEAIAENRQVNILYHKQHKLHSVIGYIHFYDMTRNELRIMNQYDKVVYIRVNNVTDIHYT
ncbi:YolD-like family protein [Bacillus sp. XF8]|uniref:YolD-like family protein n=1 Tax=Bacillus sp. XF8 TaxID=2819289 RepID=UPI001AA09099|nr:YolD-like family protein [Bacillus sp. XF8]MBO1582729.1 YolD-like family protein [Bacillus sp. XF8]